jgi:hypothetical protein
MHYSAFEVGFEETTGGRGVSRRPSGDRATSQLARSSRLVLNPIEGFARDSKRALAEVEKK